MLCGGQPFYFKVENDLPITNIPQNHREVALTEPCLVALRLRFCSFNSAVAVGPGVVAVLAAG